jgi:effector-binding domain-containing protein
MIDTPTVLQTTPQLTATLHITVPRDEIQNVMGPAIQELLALMAAQGATPNGPWFTHHFARPTEVFDFDICMPVETPVVAEGRMVPGEWPAMKVARTVYSGPFEGLGEAWGEFAEWIDASGLTPASDFWERYLVGPEATDDSTAWRTELNRPLLD